MVWDERMVLFLGLRHCLLELWAERNFHVPTSGVDFTSHWNSWLWA